MPILGGNPNLALKGGADQKMTTRDCLWPPLFIIESFFTIKTKIFETFQKIGSADKNIDNSANFYDIVEKNFWTVTDAPLEHYKEPLKSSGQIDPPSHAV